LSTRYVEGETIRLSLYFSINKSSFENRFVSVDKCGEDEQVKTDNDDDRDG
jgi:hypothetical protein